MKAWIKEQRARYAKGYDNEGIFVHDPDHACGTIRKLLGALEVAVDALEQQRLKSKWPNPTFTLSEIRSILLREKA